MAWSYSSISTFKQCPKKYFHLKVAVDVQDTGSEAMVYGNQVHKAAEEFVKSGAPIPPKFKFVEPIVHALNKITGVKHCELKLGIRKTKPGYEPCGFFDKDVWWRGIADLFIKDETKGFLVDYKTSKSARYADTKQLDMLAGAMFVHHPEMTIIKSALAFVVSSELVKKKHTAENTTEYLSVFDAELDRLDGAILSGVWNANPGPLCGWCPVVLCEHNTKRR